MVHKFNVGDTFTFCNTGNIYTIENIDNSKQRVWCSQSFGSRKRNNKYNWGLIVIKDMVHHGQIVYTNNSLVNKMRKLLNEV